jgi:hypothetical protein
VGACGAVLVLRLLVVLCPIFGYLTHMRNTILLILALTLVTSCGGGATEEKLVEGPMGLHVGDSFKGSIPDNSTNQQWSNFGAPIEVTAVGKDWIACGERRWHADRLKDARQFTVTCPHDK